MYCIGAIICSLLAVNFYQKARSKKANDTLVVGMMSGWPPFMSINKQGEFEGFDVDVARKLAQQLKKKIIIKDFGSLSPLFLALQQNKIDVIFSGLDITEQRLKKLSMVPYCGQEITSFYLIFWNNIPSNIRSLDDLKTLSNPIVSVELNSTTEKFIDQFSFIKKKALSSVTDTVLDIKYGKSLAALIEPSVANRLIEKKPELKTITIPIPPQFRIYGNGIAIKKDNKALAQTVSKTINTLKQAGILKQLEQKWNIEGV